MSQPPRVLSTDVLQRARDRIVSFPGTSQFTAQGISACGLAAFNFARIAFRIEQAGANVANELASKRVVEEIVAICAAWSQDMHLEVDDIHSLPIFHSSLRLSSTSYGRPGPRYFQSLLQGMNKIDTSVAMIITRPPEIIACLKLVDADSPVFVVFDSHTRPSHPDGAGLSFSTSMENTARTLCAILPPIHLDSSDFQWQAQLLANCSAHLYVAKHRRKDHEAAVIQSSLEILDLRRHIETLKCENKQLGSDKENLESEVDRLRASIRQAQSTAEYLAAFVNPPVRRGVISHAVAGPSRLPDKRARPYPNSGPAGAQSIFAQNPPPVPSQMIPPDDDDDDDDAELDDRWIQSLLTAYSVQNDFDSEHARSVHKLPEHRDRQRARQLQDQFSEEQRRLHKQFTHLSREQNQFHQEHAHVARQLQDQFDDEDRRLRREQEELVRHIQATFECSICLDELPEDDVARIDVCVHTMCRSCLRSFVSSKIYEHRYPIFCPMCTIGAQDEPGVISRLLIEQLGVSEEQIQILTEMELAEFTIQIHCRKCKRPAFVDREDYTEVPNVVCPQSDCHHVWCKKCEQSIVVDGPKHSCDGSSELDHLMKEKGWKHCPNCTTPIQKESGCNHMMCISPGCNSHFCYVCGCMIVRSALNHEIGQAVSAHFRRCQLFEVPD